MAQSDVARRQDPASNPYLNRELSRFDFSERVLSMAEDPRQPLLERVRFLSIWGGYIDELFQVRVAALKEQLLAAPDAVSTDGLRPDEQLALIRGRMEVLIARQDRLLRNQLVPALAEARIRLVSASELSRGDRTHLAETFRGHIFPVLTPLAVDPAHPFPYISNLSLNLAVMVGDKHRQAPRFARVKMPPVLPRFLRLPDQERFIPVEQVVGLNLRALFPGMEILEHHPFRITRDAALDLVDEDTEDLLAAIQSELRRQWQTAMAVRLEVDEGMSAEIRQLLVRELELVDDEVYTMAGMLDLGGLGELYKLDRSELKARPWIPVTPSRLRALEGEAPDLFRAIRGGDLLVHHPYDSFVTSVEAFITQAAHDPKVLAIKQTLYRTSGPVNPIVRSLISAAEAGKQVVALIELKARGDEQANIGWAEALEESGVHVVYGVVGLKTHSKTTLVLRQEEDRIRTYVHLGTGNYNAQTALTYEDLSLFSADPDLGTDVGELFNFLTGYSRQSRYRRLLVAPMTMRSGLLKLIRRETTRLDGRIVMKVNNLADTEIIDALYAASRAGAEIDLMVRSVCSLRPGVPGLSERIRVRSVLGQFLEHSRIFRFGPDSRAEYYIGSADLMQRNLDRRVEVLTPISGAPLCRLLAEILTTAMADDTRAWRLEPDGSWLKIPSEAGVDAQQRLRELALSRGISDA